MTDKQLDELVKQIAEAMAMMLVAEKQMRRLEAENSRLRQALVDVSEWWIDGRDPAALALGALNGGKNAETRE